MSRKVKGRVPDDMAMELVEPVKLLFKDEVRVVGEALGLPHGMVYRQPFPGPGLGVRCLGAITRDRLHALREADAILREEFDKAGLAGKVWQYFIAVPDVKSVGVRDSKRYEGWPAIIRAVNTVDAMTATIEEIPYEILHKITNRITHEVDGINRVLYYLTPKPIGIEINTPIFHFTIIIEIGPMMGFRFIHCINAMKILVQLVFAICSGKLIGNPKIFRHSLIIITGTDGMVLVELIVQCQGSF